MDDRVMGKWDEAARLARLRALGIVDTHEEADFDDLVEIASEICGTPFALVSLVEDDRQFFKAEKGLGIRETPIETSFCVHAIREDEVMIVEDASRDPRFLANPLVTGAPHLRFYAGAVLRTRDGVPIGTLCVLDHRPRKLDPRQIRHLVILARQVMTQIELRETLAEQNRLLEAARTAERRRDAVIREMAHRMKNSLAMVQAIVTQTFRHASTLEEGHAAITARLAALSRSQDILTFEKGAVAPIREVVAAALAPHRSGEGRFRVAGPEIDLPGPQVLGLTLALHELASNAAKYGALSGPSGTASVNWTVGEDGRFEFAWLEEDGPPVAPPRRRGFGSRLLERIVASYFDGEATLAFSQEGVRFLMSGVAGATPPDEIEG